MYIIVDDEPMLTELIHWYVKDMKHIVVQSLEELKNLPVDDILKTHCVISDMNLGCGNNAHNVKEYVRSINKDICVILMTGTIPEPELKDQFNDILLKPFKKEDIRDMCNKYHE